MNCCEHSFSRNKKSSVNRLGFKCEGTIYVVFDIRFSVKQILNILQLCEMSK